MSATTHDRLKTEIETAYAPAEDNSFADTSDERVGSGWSSCYATNPEYTPTC